VKRSRRLVLLPSFLISVALLAVVGWALMVRMPGASHRGPLPSFTEAERHLAAELERDVRVLAGKIGDRSSIPAQGRAIHFIEHSLQESGLTARSHVFSFPNGVDVVERCNVWTEILGSTHPDQIVVVGAHYDSVKGCPGANDNASGVAALLAIARRLAASQPERTLRFVAFTDEEPPCFQTERMGSLAYAKACKAKGENIAAMISLETLGCYSEEEGSQTYPLPILRFAYPSRGNFVAFVGNVASSGLVREAIETFRETTAIPSEGTALPGWIPGVGWSDQWSFWQQGYPAIMVTDTAPFRYRHYHKASDTPDKLDYERLARVVEGLSRVVARLGSR
jgi:hypothetical protein